MTSGSKPMVTVGSKSMTSIRKIKAILYDMDGLLLDTENFYTDVTQKIVSRYGKNFDWSIKAQMLGRPALESAETLIRALELPIKPEQYLAERKVLLNQRFPEAEAMSGAIKLTLRMKASGVPQAVATSSTKEAYSLKTTKHQQWFGEFDAIITGDHPDIQKGKPAPDIFLVAARALGVNPSECLVFEDAPAGVRAARAAGMSVVVVPDPQMDQTLVKDADLHLKSLLEFNSSDWSLPV
jgi:pseudouridine-5'-monophosphatase